MTSPFYMSAAKGTSTFLFRLPFIHLFSISREALGWSMGTICPESCTYTNQRLLSFKYSGDRWGKKMQHNLDLMPIRSPQKDLQHDQALGMVNKKKAVFCQRSFPCTQLGFFGNKIKMHVGNSGKGIALVVGVLTSNNNSIIL